MQNLSEATKLPANARFATLGRALADSLMSNRNPELIICELARLRELEQQPAEEMAGLARQIGDAARHGAPVPQELLTRMMRVRSRELHGH